MSILQMFRAWLNLPSTDVEQTKDLYYNERFFSGTQGLKAARHCPIPYEPSSPRNAEIRALPSADLVNKKHVNLSHNGTPNQQHRIACQDPTSVDYLAVTPYVQQKAVINLFLDQVKGYSNQRQWDRAIAICRKVLALDPQQVQAYWLMGKIYQAKEEPYEAMGYYAEALILQPESIEIYSELGSLYQGLQEWQQAIDYYQQAIALASTASTPEAIGALNVAQAGLIESQIQHQRQPKETPHSVDAIYESLSLSPETFTAQEHCEMAYLLLKQGDGDNAIESFKRAIQCQPSCTEAHLQLGALFEERQQWQDAMFHYKQAVYESELSDRMSLNPLRERHQLIDITADAAADHSPSFKSELKDDGIADNRPSQPKVALTALPSASSTVNNSPKPGALEAIPHLQEADPLLSSVQSFVSLAHSYEQHGDIEKAITHYRNALSLDPDNQDIHQRLNLVLAQQTA